MPGTILGVSVPRFFSPAKINLFLKVLEKRPDGYHHLSSLFQALSFGDHLEVGLSDQDQFECSHPFLPMDEKNLVVRALRLFREKTGIAAPLNVRLKKSIPMEAGLGGGSSNAATMLFACNKLFACNLTDKTLMEWGAELGSDVAFYFSLGSAYCSGRGEKVFSVPSLKQKEPLTIVKPPLGLSTASVFKGCVPSIENWNEETVYKNCLKGEYLPFNDLEKSAFQIAPALHLLKQELKKSGYSSVTMTGTGSSFVCFGKGEAPEGCLSISATFLNRTPGHWYEETNKC